jgi:hypothetical protein
MPFVRARGSRVVKHPVASLAFVASRASLRAVYIKFQGNFSVLFTLAA